MASIQGRDTVLSREQVYGLIARGRKVLIVDGQVLQVDAWLPYHPGGDKAILHMVGRDASNEVLGFHSTSTLRSMQRYRIGVVVGPWEDFVPPIQGGVFQATAAKYDARTEESVDVVPGDDSSAGDSASEASLVFDLPEHTSTRARKRRVSVGGASDSSATSFDTSELQAATEKRKPSFNGDNQTKEEIEYDLAKFPSLDPQTQANIIQKYRQLEQRISDNGLYNCNYTSYLFEILRYSFLALLSRWFLLQGWYIASAIFLGMLWHQLVFTVHDAGHIGITHHYHLDSCIGMFIANYIGGLSLCWWKRNHNVHHIVTNSTEHDPDIQHMPFFAISHRFFENLRSTYHDRIMTYDIVAQLTLKYQHYLYYPILAFGRFNLYALSWQYIFLGKGPRKGPSAWHRYFEIVGQLVFWYWFGYRTVYLSIPTAGSRVLFILVSHMITAPVHVQITLSHFAMSTADLGVAESFPQKMLRTTMDVDCPQWLDFFHGGLQFQVIHHLFPRVPRHNLRQCQKFVMEFCDDVKIPYTIYGFKEGNDKVIGRLGEVAKQARMLAECQRSITLADALHGH